MSIGRSEKNEPVRINYYRTLRKGFEDSIKSYFVDPLRYLFYMTLTATVISLFLNREISWQFYAFLAGLGFVELARWSIKYRDKKNTPKPGDNHG